MAERHRSGEYGRDEDRDGGEEAAVSRWLPQWIRGASSVPRHGPIQPRQADSAAYRLLARSRSQGQAERDYGLHAGLHP